MTDSTRFTALTLLAVLAGCAPLTLTDTETHRDAPAAPNDAMLTDADSTADAGVAVDAASTDAAAIADAWSGTDAWAPTGTCGNGTIDPGEVCDPGVRVLAPDGGTVVLPTNAAYCTASCTAVTCIVGAPITGTGTPADHRCVYHSAAAPAPTRYPGWVARVLSWGSVAERNAYIAALRTLSPGTTTTGHIAAQRMTVAGTSCSGSSCGSACSTTPASTCGATGRCVAWFWTPDSGPFASMPVVGMPRTSASCPSLATHVYLTITDSDVTSTQDTFDGPGYLVVLDPPGSAL